LKVGNHSKGKVDRLNSIIQKKTKAAIANNSLVTLMSAQDLNLEQDLLQFSYDEFSCKSIAEILGPNLAKS
jgi:hypothetical protein